MIPETVVAILAGVIVGIFTGLTPGIHTNFVSALLIASLPLLNNYFSVNTLVSFIVVMTMINLFLEFIPSIYLCAPDEETVLSTLPGHDFLLAGKAHQAVFLSVIGGVMGIIVSFLITAIFFFSIQQIYVFVEKTLAIILIWISLLIVCGEKEKILAAIIFVLASFLGIASLNLEINQPLLPLLTGLFGSSSLMVSINQKTKIPAQICKLEKPNKETITKPLIAGMTMAPLFSFLPGIGSSQATIISSKLFKKISRDQFIVLNGMINTLLMVLSFAALFLIQKARTGSANAIAELTYISKETLIAILVVALLSGIFGAIISLNISKMIIKKIHCLNYSKVSLIVLISLLIIILLVSGLLGLCVLAVSTFLGLTCHYLNIRKGILMSCLLTPTILYYLPF